MWYNQIKEYQFINFINSSLVWTSYIYNIIFVYIILVDSLHFQQNPSYCQEIPQKLLNRNTNVTAVIFNDSRDTY